MSKRRAEDELTKDNAHVDEEYDDRFAPVDPVKRASQDVLAGRTIAKPRSLLRGAGAGTKPAANPFSSAFGTPLPAQPATEAAPANPFSFFGNSGLKPSAPASFTAPQAAKPADSTVSSSANPPAGAAVQSQKVKVAALNAKFAQTIANYAKSSASGDWTKACRSYISYYEKLSASNDSILSSSQNSTADISMDQGSGAPSASDSESEADTPSAPVDPSITNTGFKFSGSAKEVGFSFGGKVLENSAETKPSGLTGFVFKPTNEKSGADLPFAPKADQKPQATETKPAFSFGSSSNTPEPSTTEAPAKPTFTFGANASAAASAEKPAFNFGSAKKEETPTGSSSFSFAKPSDEKPKFTFGQGTLDKPKFSFGQDNGEKPKFTFGAGATDSAPSSEKKPVFNFGQANTDSDKPKFTFAQAAEGDKPKFSFGTTTSWTPGDQIKFDQPAQSGKAGDDSAQANGNDGEDGEEEDGEPAEPSIDLSGKGPGEENEDTVYEKKAKVYELVDGQFKPVGLGNLRVLVDKGSQKSRVLVRADGSGRVLVNIGLRKQISYTHEGNGQVKVLDFPAADKAPVTYLVRVKTATDGDELKAKLEEVKN